MMGASWTRAALILAAAAVATPLVAGRSIDAIQTVQQTPVQTGTPLQAEKLEPPSVGAISGTVFDGAGGEEVSGALVMLQPIKTSKPLTGVITRQITDEHGRFVFLNLPGASEYMVSVTKFGYLGGGYGREHQPSEPLKPLVMAAEEWISGLRVNIWKPGAISGVVRDEAGEPVVGVYVRALMRVRIQGREDLAAGAMVTTDDRGAYRMTGLAPARYYIQVPSVQAAIPAATKLPTSTAASSSTWDALDTDDLQRLVIGKYPLPPPPVAGRQLAYPLIFYPATSVLAQAMPIDLAYGEDRSGLDVTISPVPSVRVSGTVEGPQDALQLLTLRLLPAGLENLGLGAEAATALVGPDGRFTFLNVPAGNYTLDAPVSVTELSTQDAASSFRRTFPAPPSSRGRGMNSDTIDLVPGISIVNSSWRSGAGPYSGRMPLIVGGANVDGIVMRLRQHAKMGGRVVVEADPSTPDVRPPTRFTISLDSARGDTYLGRPQSAFDVDPPEFFVGGIVPGQYWLRVQGYPAWVVKSVIWKDRDYTAVPFDAAETSDFSGVVVTVTNATPQLTGTVRGTLDVKADSTVVIAFPSDQALWRNTGFYPARLKMSAVTTTGAFGFKTLPAGEYLIAAIDRQYWTSWRDEAFLEKVARSASRVKLEWAGKVNQDLQPIVVR